MVTFDDYVNEMDDLLSSIEHDKDLLHSKEASLMQKEYVRSSIDEKLTYFHKLFIRNCMQIMDDIFEYHMFEVASTVNLQQISIETELTLNRYYQFCRDKIHLNYIDIVLQQEFGDTIFNLITNNVNEDYIYLTEYYEVKLNKYVMLSKLYKLIRS